MKDKYNSMRSQYLTLKAIQGRSGAADWFQMTSEDRKEVRTPLLAILTSNRRCVLTIDLLLQLTKTEKKAGTTTLLGNFRELYDIMDKELGRNHAVKSPHVRETGGKATIKLTTTAVILLVLGCRASS